MTRANKTWTEAEKQFLEDHWGEMTVQGIAKKLNRPAGGVINMKNRLQLGRYMDSGKLVALNQVSVALFGPNHGSYTINRLVRNGLPVKLRRVNKNRFKMVDMDEFWEWAEQNKTILNFKNFREHELGPEPEWARDKRRMDFETSMKERRNKNDPWTPQDDRKLQRMIDANKYTYSDIAAELRRSEGAVMRRITTAGIKGKPVRYPNKPWTDEETEALISMVERGIDWAHISASLGRSQLQVRGKYERCLNPECMKRSYRSNSGKKDYIHIREITPSEVRENMRLASIPPR